MQLWSFVPSLAENSLGTKYTPTHKILNFHLQKKQLQGGEHNNKKTRKSCHEHESDIFVASFVLRGSHVSPPEKGTKTTNLKNLLQRFCSGWLGHWNCCQTFHWMLLLVNELLLLLLFLWNSSAYRRRRNVFDPQFYCVGERVKSKEEIREQGREIGTS